MQNKTRTADFKNITITLVEPITAGNIGSVARVLMNTGFRKIDLVNPVMFNNDEGLSRACNATDVLLGARSFPTLDDALEKSGFVVGTTRRKGKVRHPLFTLNETVPKILQMSRSNKVSIVFGREDKGLKNEELERCDMLFEIPSHEDYASLNLSHAVFAVCHALFTAEDLDGDEPTIVAASRAELDLMYEHLERALKLLGYGEGGKKAGLLLNTIVRNFRKLFGRTALMKREANMVRGVLSEIEKKVDKGGGL